MNLKSLIGRASFAALAVFAMNPAAAADATSPLRNGAYAAVLGTAAIPTNRDQLNNGYGGTLAVGYRRDWYALELAPAYVKFSNTEYRGGGVNALIFPFSSFPYVYGIGGISILQYASFPTTVGNKDFNTLGIDGGLGFIYPLLVGRYEFGLRAEGRYRYGSREREYNDQDIDLSAPRKYKQAVINVGLQLPFGLVPAPPAVAEPVAPDVVPVEPRKDTDGDGVLDGTDQCPDSPPGSVVDVTGCPPSPPPPPPCKTPGPGEKISLAGCGTGDNIVLRGVNFDTNKATLTVNAKALLDDVVSELKRYPGIGIQIAGHTDSRGSAALNESLSQRRAASVMSYLLGSGIDASRMSSLGFGPNQPIADNATDEGREQNRRVELKIVSGAATTPPN